jgi:hypothetical protein
MASEEGACQPGHGQALGDGSRGEISIERRELRIHVHREIQVQRPAFGTDPGQAG